MNTRPFQSGVILAVTLFMLGLLTLLGISAVMLGTTHFRLVGNLQAEKEAEMAMQMAVERFISVPDPTHGRVDAFNPPAAPAQSSLTLNGQTITVDITQPRCVGYVESTDTGTTYATLWEFQAVARSTATGTCLAYRWGVSAPMPPQLCVATGTEPSATPCP